MEPLGLRPMEAADLEPLTDLWMQGWRDGHSGKVPEGLERLRTRENFRERLLESADDCHLAGPVGAPTAFVRVRGGELDQVYVRADLRGTGLAARLMAAAEAKMQGVGTAWLFCSVTNPRAARFYQKSGWRNAGVVRIGTETSAGPFEVEVWRFEKAL